MHQIRFDSDLIQFKSNSNMIQTNFKMITDPSLIKILVLVQLDKLTQSSLNKIKSN